MNVAGAVLDLAEAMRVIYNADSQVQTLTGRTDFNLLPRGAQKYDETLPVTTWEEIISSPFRGSAGRARVVIQLEAWANMQTHNLETLTGLLDRAVELFSAVNLDGQGIDAAVEPTPNYRDGLLEDEDQVRSKAVDLTFDLTVT